jgi:hypothetical protein
MLQHTAALAARAAAAQRVPVVDRKPPGILSVLSLTEILEKGQNLPQLNK